MKRRYSFKTDVLLNGQLLDLFLRFFNKQKNHEPPCLTTETITKCKLKHASWYKILHLNRRLLQIANNGLAAVFLLNEDHTFFNTTWIDINYSVLING